MVRRTFKERLFVLGKKERRLLARLSPKIKVVKAVYQKEHAYGFHGCVFDLVALGPKGRRINLCVKRYLPEFLKYSGLTQTVIAEKEFEFFQKLKKEKLPVPPIVWLVDLNGKKHLALSDLSKLGDMQVKYEGRRALEIELEGIISRGQVEEVAKVIENYNEKARALGLEVKDGWEIIIDVEKKTLKPFILDITDKIESSVSKKKSFSSII